MQFENHCSAWLIRVRSALPCTPLSSAVSYLHPFFTPVPWTVTSLVGSISISCLPSLLLPAVGVASLKHMATLPYTLLGFAPSLQRAAHIRGTVRAPAHLSCHARYPWPQPSRVRPSCLLGSACALPAPKDPAPAHLPRFLPPEFSSTGLDPPSCPWCH